MRNTYNNSDVNSEKQGEKYKPDNFTTVVNRWEEKRTCLKCGKEFPSVGPYNRICVKCDLMNVRQV
ncbi:MAG: hypothetical protein D8M57_08280 [Candidatus Scalindua sp. AMX11]|nr:MAG: hypothetical protein DWQ00_05135 [Candidatus Scalindua sp.]NOG84339.1 hypothetical protein [Planctomycetota bacterium]RZV74420.1 MAG: hypothetical protein EX341_13020 [Candidatus Scalindua sp. SCAELEC01]TDE65340.1 MAG: hypothetical protein D8M57_08280 [Candidatus Scalindua sp. AMX11]GJQ60835.1 MAG: hypothetical protein SCALA701_36360 [Candidatus Scalindua sp.]